MTETTYKLRERGGSYRLWIESRHVLRHYGFEAGQRFNIVVKRTTFDLVLDDDGTNKVSESKRDGESRPIIDIVIPKSLPWLGEATHVVAKFEQGVISIRKA